MQVAKAPALCSIPLELLLKIAFYLHFEDFINLRNASDRLYDLLSEERVSRQVSKQYFPFSKEAGLAQQKLMTYSSAVQRVFDRNKALSLAKPYSVATLARISNEGIHIYQAGKFCYIDDRTVRILDAHNASMTENVVDLLALLEGIARHQEFPNIDMQGLCEAMREPPSKNLFKLQGYEHGILSISVIANGSQYLIVVNPQESLVASYKRVRLVFLACENVTDDVIHAVRTDGRYLVVATVRLIVGEPWIHVGVISCWDLKQRVNLLPETEVQRFNVRKGDPREVYVISDGWFYSISDGCPVELSDEEIVEHDYYCYRFPLHDCQPAPAEKSTAPPQHNRHGSLPKRMEVIRIPRYASANMREGVAGREISAHISLTRCECTGKLMIIEGRRLYESQDPPASAEEKELSTFAFHLQTLIFPDPPRRRVTSPLTHTADIVQTLSEADMDELMEPHEYTIKMSSLSRSSYNYSAATAIIQTSFTETPDKLSFSMTNSPRRRISPINPSTGLLSPSFSNSIKGQTRFTYDASRRFPSMDAPQALLDIINPFDGIEPVRSRQFLHDERSAVVLVRSDKEMAQAYLINFDSWIDFPNFPILPMPTLSDEVSPNAFTKQNEKGSRRPSSTASPVEEENISEHNHKGNGLRYEQQELAQATAESSSHSQDSKPDLVNELKSLDVNEQRPNNPSWLRTERAMWVDINQGYRLVEDPKLKK